jgi:hypothetical protein
MVDERKRKVREQREPSSVYAYPPFVYHLPSNPLSSIGWRRGIKGEEVLSQA